ncbi:probable receptor-like protein kinase At2g23200 [Morus notabilis]|uniref:probable receptor-like protein kinase At2g23200 n=2 Tax=Morus notabilis TaxID=981085 RepID=UPI000CED3666|nr:probable receptor-like protein kinase At2g23200 [Morus notabilis]
MEKFHSQRLYIPPFPFLLFLLQFSSLHLFSSAYNLPDKYFINCGSNQGVSTSRRSFVGDKNSGSVSFTKQNSISVENTNQSQNSNNSTLYNTARVFRQQSSYAFDINDVGNSTNYLVRLHFLVFPSTVDLSSAVFDVSASGFLLLHNFTAKNNTNTPLVKEFYLPINANKKFRIYFTPLESSLAFVNAIEFFPAPPVNFSLGEAIKVGQQQGQKTGSSSVFQTVYRINVGGQEIESNDEIIWRNWDTDDKFLISKGNSKESQFYSNPPNYLSEDGEYVAPALVYQTAREMDVNASGGSNITWGFNVNKSAGHLVRFHFCDIISVSLGVIVFNLYINGNFSKAIDPTDNSTLLATPFHYDFSVGSHGSDVMNIGIGLSKKTTENNAFLNGLEILEIKRGLALTPVENEESGNKKTKAPIVIGSAIGGFALLCILVVGFFKLRRRKMKPVENSSWGQVPPYVGGGSSHSRIADPTINGSPLPNLHLGLKIPFAEIQLATKNFNSKLIIGKGGFGNVYKGTLVNGTKVAVKRSAPGSGQGLPEFQTEITILSKIRHRHLVSLIGYCDERSEMILVYEFVEMGTLRDHLYNPDLPRLSWKQRLEICIGAANGLHYLHKGLSGGIIHRDVKSTNILLDKNHVAKVSDFGLSKSGPLDEFETHVSTNVKGTLGYLDPEYFRTQQLTEKSDVYSFGVVLLEVLCARPAIDTLLPREQMNLAEWAMKCKNKGLLEDIIDPSMKGQINPNSLRKFSETAEKCLEEDSGDRPAMSDVIWDLEYAFQLQQMPVPRQPHEDSTVNSSSAFLRPNVEHLPSVSTTADNDGDNEYGLSNVGDFSEVSASAVFSLLKTDGAK